MNRCIAFFITLMQINNIFSLKVNIIEVSLQEYLDIIEPHDCTKPFPEDIKNRNVVRITTEDNEKITQQLIIDKIAKMKNLKPENIQLAAIGGFMEEKGKFMVLPALYHSSTNSSYNGQIIRKIVFGFYDPDDEEDDKTYKEEFEEKFENIKKNSGLASIYYVDMSLPTNKITPITTTTTINSNNNITPKKSGCCCKRKKI